MSKANPFPFPDPTPRLTLLAAEHPAAREAVPRSQFTGTMSTLASSVSVVSALVGGERHGRTVTALMSLSAEPPALLVSITRDSGLADAIAAAQAFSVAVLAQGQQDVADAFAGLGPDDRFSAGEWDEWPSGQPRLTGATAALDCRLAGSMVMDTHIVFAGIVARTRTHADRPPLLWHQRGYAALDDGRP